MKTLSFFTKHKEYKFWKWFSKNSKRIDNFEKDQEEIFDEIQNQLQKINPYLTFEISCEKNGKRDFIISADGILEAFPAVEKLYSMKPKLSEWNFIKFRPPRKIENSIRIGNKELCPKDIRYKLIKNKMGILNPLAATTTIPMDIILFCNGYTEQEHEVYSQVAFLFLDECLGEYYVEKYIGKITLQSFDNEDFDNSMEIQCLHDEVRKIEFINGLPIIS